MYMRMTVAALLAAASLWAGEADAKALAAQAKAVWTDAARQGDAWTCLQLEAWARERKPALRLGSVLADSLVTGEVRFALPAYVTHLTDLGDRIVMATSDRAWVVAPDGRPLQPSVRLQPTGGWQITGHGGAVVGVCRRVRNDGKAALEFGSVALATGAPVAQARLDLAPTQHWGEELVVAADGSALATIMVSEDGLDRMRVRNTLVAVDKRTWIVRECREPFGVGPHGAWLLARGLGNRGYLLVRGDARTAIAAGAAGPGIAGCVIDGKAVLVGAKGADSPLAGAPAAGEHVGMISVGGWLVMGSGYGAKVMSAGDLLGEDAGGLVDQPPTLALWRWADLLADPAAKPVTTMPGELSQAHDRPAAIWVWKDKALDLVDLQGDAPVRTRWLEAEAPIAWASSDMHCVRLQHGEPQRSVLYGPDKAVLWSGECQDLRVKRRDLALSDHRDGDGRVSRRLQWLSSDPAKRRTVPVAIAPEADECQVSVYPPDLVLGRGPRRSWWTAGFDGKALDSGDGDAARPIPDCPEWNWFAPTGRYYREGARVYEKALGPPAEPLHRLQLADAWRMSSTTMLLQNDGRVLVSGRKRGEWSEIGVAEGAQRLGLIGPLPALLREDGRPLSLMVPGPKLSAIVKGDPAQELPVGGPWRLMDDGRFTPPRSRQLQWDGDRVGWGWVRLRSPDGSGLFVITASALIELDPDAARLFGK